MATGRTVSRFRRVYIDGYDMSKHAINIGPLAVTYPEKPIATFADEIMGTFPGIPNISCGTLNGVLDNTATSGLHVVVNGAGGNRYVMVAQGIRAAPAQGDPCFAGVFEQLSYQGVVSSVDDTVTVTIPFGGWSPNSVLGYGALNDAWGPLLHANAAEIAANTAIGVDDLAASTNGGVFFWHILASNGTATISAQHSTTTNLNASFGTLTGATSGEQAAGVSFGLGVVASGVTVGRYLRWQLSLNSATSVSFVCSFVRAKV